MFRFGRLALRSFLRSTEKKVESTLGEGLMRLRFVTPHENLCEKPLKMVSIPSAEGELVLVSGHLPTIAELTPGVVSLYTDDSTVSKYFVSGGFAIVTAEGETSVTVPEAIPLSDLDTMQAKKLLDEYNGLKVKATTEVEKAQAEIACDLFGTMVFALEHH